MVKMRKILDFLLVEFCIIAFLWVITENFHGYYESWDKDTWNDEVFLDLILEESSKLWLSDRHFCWSENIQVNDNVIVYYCQINYFNYLYSLIMSQNWLYHWIIVLIRMIRSWISLNINFSILCNFMRK